MAVADRVLPGRRRSGLRALRAVPAGPPAPVRRPARLRRSSCSEPDPACRRWWRSPRTNTSCRSSRRTSGSRPMTAGVLAALSPVAALVVQLQPLMLPLMIVPVLAVYNSAHLGRRQGTSGQPRRPDRVWPTVSSSANGRSAPSTTPMRSGQPLAVMMIDLDHFKEINDTLGHQVGDELICEVADRLEEARPVGSTVARLGGDEFAVLLPDIPDISVAEDVATYLLSVLAKSVLGRWRATGRPGQPGDLARPRARHRRAHPDEEGRHRSLRGQAGAGTVLHVPAGRGHPHSRNDCRSWPS